MAVRNVTQLPGGAIKHERVYLGGVEVYRVHAGADGGLVRETLLAHCFQLGKGGR